MSSRGRKNEREQKSIGLIVRDPDVPMVTLLVISSLTLRVWGANYGLPAAIGNNDEIYVVRNALSFGATRSLRPIYFNYPTLYAYLLFVGFGLYFLVGRLTGAFAGLSDFAFQYLVHPGNFHLVGRLLSSLVGGLTVIPIYLLGRRAFGRPVGIVAALLLCLAPTHVFQSHWALPDVTMVFFVAWALVFTHQVLTTGGRLDYLLASATIGLAISTKYNATLLVLALLVAHGLQCRRRRVSLTATIFNPNLIISVGIIVGAFLLGSPYWVLDPSVSLSGYLYEAAHMRAGHLGLMGGTPWLWHLNTLLQQDSVVGALMLLGLLWALARPKDTKWPLVTYAVVTFLYVGSWAKQGLHYLLPIYPALTLLGADAVVALAIPVFMGRKRADWGGVAVALVAVAWPLITIIRQDVLWAKSVDTRLQAREWIEENVPAGSRIAMDKYNYGPPLLSQAGEYLYAGVRTSSDKFGIHKDAMGDFFQVYEGFLQDHSAYEVYELSTEAETTSDRIRDPYLAEVYDRRWRTLDELRSIGVEYLILSNWVYGRYFDTSAPSSDSPLSLAFEANRTYFHELLNDPLLIQLRTFEPTAKVLGPAIIVYRVQ